MLKSGRISSRAQQCRVAKGFIINYNLTPDLISKLYERWHKEKKNRFISQIWRYHNGYDTRPEEVGRIHDNLYQFKLNRKYAYKHYYNKVLVDRESMFNDAFRTVDTTDMNQWCEENCTSEWTYDVDIEATDDDLYRLHYYWFKDNDEALLFKLRWVG